MKHLLFRLLLVAVASTVSLLATAATPPFSHMTLNGTNNVAISIEDVDRDFAVYGLSSAGLLEQVTAKLTQGGVGVVPYSEAVSNPGARLLRVRVMTNHDAHGFYHLSVKLELRQKIPLGNTAGGFVSQAVWTDAANAVMLASEIEKITALVDDLLANFISEYHAQNAAGTADNR
jgi:hypothetical protein